MILLFGVDHYMQNYDLTSSVKEWEDVERAIKEKFYNEIQETIREHSVGHIGEECKVKQRTIPLALAAEENCVYFEIDMPKEVRRAAGIADDYEKDDEQRARGYELREKYMFERITSAVTADDVGLIICGREHLNRLADLLTEGGYQTVRRDLTSESWFDPPWKKAMRGELMF